MPPWAVEPIKAPIRWRTRPDSNRRPNAPQAFALSKLCNESAISDMRALNVDCEPVCIHAQADYRSTPERDSYCMNLGAKNTGRVLAAGCGSCGACRAASRDAGVATIIGAVSTASACFFGIGVPPLPSLSGQRQHAAAIHTTPRLDAPGSRRLRMVATVQGLTMRLQRRTACHLPAQESRPSAAPPSGYGPSQRRESGPPSRTCLWGGGRTLATWYLQGPIR